MAASHYVVRRDDERAVDEIEREMRNQVAHFEEHGKQLEAHRCSSGPDTTWR